MNETDATYIIRRLDQIVGAILVLQHDARLRGLAEALPMFDEAEAQLRAIQTVIDEAMTQQGAVR